MRPPIEQMQQQIAAIDPDPWRAEFDEDGALAIWFHTDLASDPRRAAEFLVSSREYVRDLIDYTAKLEQVYREARALLRNPARRASAQNLYDAIQVIDVL